MKRFKVICLVTMLFISLSIGTAFAGNATTGCSTHGFRYEVYDGQSVRYSYIDQNYHYMTTANHYHCELCGLKEIWAISSRVKQSHTSSCTLCVRPSSAALRQTILGH